MKPLNLLFSALNFFWIRCCRNVVFFIQKYKWKKMNSHNFTSIGNYFDIKKVIVGKGTYGQLNVKSFNNDEEKLLVGSYVSIAENVVFLLGGNHRVDLLTSYPLYSNLLARSAKHDALTKGPIVIEDEVWIGFGTCVLSGVKVGKGAVIAACSVVTKDIPPYAIVGGNPAKILKFRFDSETIEKLKSIKLSDLPEDIIRSNIDKFYNVSEMDSLFELFETYIYH